jgi:hypothetical protein
MNQLFSGINHSNPDWITSRRGNIRRNANRELIGRTGAKLAVESKTKPSRPAHARRSALPKIGLS